MPPTAIQQAADLLIQAQFAVALTGAGISTRSGIPDFRSHGSGLWEKYDPMTVASITSFKVNPEAFYDWIRPLAQNLIDAHPNEAHTALARLEELGKLQSVITQNIDMLHTRAGSRTVHEVHGHLREATCIKCYRIFPSEQIISDFLADADQAVLRCPVCGGVLKPNVILFGEQLPFRVLEAAERDTRRCDVMLIAGTSLEVYPVADLPRQARACGAKLILIDHDSNSYDKMADVVINGDLAEILPQIVEAVETQLNDG